MKILHILPSLQQSYGGPIRAVLDLSARATKFGLESEILGFGELSVPDNPLDPNRIHSLPVSMLRRYCYSPGLRTWLRANLQRFSGVVLHGMWLYPNWAASSECRKLGIPYACFPHGMLEPWAVYRQSPWKAIKKVIYWRVREQRIFSRARCSYFTTNRERDLAKSTFHLGGMHLLLAPYGVDVSQERAVAPATPRLLQPPDRKIALFLGRLHPKKNVSLLIEAWRHARPPESWHLVIAGSGDDVYSTQLRKLISDLDLTEQVHMVGFVSGEDKSYLLQRASWFLLPSQQENFGVAVVEAITHGCPVVISDQVYIADSMHEQSEILSLDPDEWVKFIRERMQDDVWRNTIVALDRERLFDTLSIQAVARRWASVLTETFQ